MAIPYDKMRNLVGLLKLSDPLAYDRLSLELRGHSNALPVGGTMGDSSSALEYSMYEGCVIAANALQQMKSIARPAISKIAEQLRASNRIALIGEVVAAICAAGLITAIWGAPPKDSVGHITSIILAALTLTGTLSTLYARYLRRDISGADGVLSGSYRKLVDGVWEAGILGTKLELLITKGEDAAGTKEAAALIERAEKLAADIYRTVNDAGVPVGTTA
ncbi:hypothetical protein NNO04_14930 [Citrobacter sp. Awk 4]|uniref:hypothetical protein n=1 Tax=Citrobacter sp. Awk 4 TaxID=2963955 RepID=UPI002304AF82|nr:hypothetical protein [Citrobacter sp. Awk 4]MDA8479990.1 hypothetical protein [Citrobacter sp. Awk 4]